MALEKTGVQAVVEGKSSFDKAMASIDATVNRVTENIEKKTGRASSQLGRTWETLTKQGESLRSKVSDLAREFGGNFGNVISDVLTKFSAVSLSAVAVAGAIALVTAAIVALGTRGSALIGIGESFDRLTQSIGISSREMLQNLQTASGGTISNFDLIRQANVALAGATGEFGQAFGQALPRILEIARVQARATGQDVNFLFQSLVSGVKRASPMLIDNTGLVLKVGQANEAYAEQLGITVEQMTEQQKQMAILNALMEAGDNAIATLGNQNETAAEKMQRLNATITNTLDSLSLNVQPAFGLFLDAINRVVARLGEFAAAFGPILEPILTTIGTFVNGAVTILMTLVDPFLDLAQNILPYVGLAVQALGTIFQGVINIIVGIVRSVVDWLRGVTRTFFGIDFEQLGPALFRGAAFAFGALAAGIMQAANQLIFPTVIAIARFIADFLMGMSPPPKGPLSTIDKGGAAVMEAWLDGFVGAGLGRIEEVAGQITGILLQPVNQVRAEVAAAMGSIAKMSFEQVEARLAQLDRAIEPFKNKLEIIKANFEALAAPAQAALNAIERQMEKAVQALLRGEEGSDQLVRSLDNQREALEGALDAQQALVDQATVQLGLAQAQQARERALLNIRKAQVKPAEQAAKAVADAKKTATGKAGGELKEPKGGGGAAEPPPAGGGGGIAPIGDGGIIDFLGGQAALDEAMANLQGGFKEGLAFFGTGVKGEFEANVTELQTQVGRIGEGASGLGGRIGDALESAKKTIETKFTEIKTTIETTLQTLFAGPETDGSIAHFFAQLPSNLRASLDTIGATISALWNDIVIQANILLGTLFGGPELPGSIANFFYTLPDKISAALGDIGAWIQEKLVSPISDKVTELMTTLDSLINGEEGLTFKTIWNAALNFLSGIPEAIGNALASAAQWVADTFVNPVITVLNDLLRGFIFLLQRIIIEAARVATELSNFMFQVNPDIGARLLEVAASLGKSALGLTFQPIPLVGTVGGRRGGGSGNTTRTGAASGGVFGPGMMMVGERGRELIANNANRITVFPSRVTRAMEALAAAQPQLMSNPMPGGAGMVTNNDNMSVYNTFNGIGNSGQIMRRFNSMRAFR